MIRNRVARVCAAIFTLSACTTTRTPTGSVPPSLQRSVASSWRNNGAVCYEVFVRSFYDSNGDGIGDLNGLTQKLDYINDGNPRAFMHRIAPNAFTIGEVSDSTGPLLTYYPDQLDAYFAFDLADAILGAVRAGSAQKLFPPFMRLQRELPADRWSPFLRNHDQTRTLTELGGDIVRARLAASLLLTLPGLPFVYYGEEIGMTGNKPDERLRTPMQWRPGNGAGFTSGKPWESLQGDSLTTTVDAQDNDPNSLLNLYRRLIHLRAANNALGSGELIPLVSSSGAVAAYLRRSGDSIVLVVANLGTAPLSGVTLESKERAMREGEYEMQSPLGGGLARPLRVSVDKRVRGYVPLRVLAPMETYVFQISKRVTK